MEKYNYLEAVTADAKKWLLDNYEIDFLVNSEDYSTYYEEMINDDNVTGNANGSYTMNTWKAEENLCHNNHLLARAADQFGYNEIPRTWIESAETADVIIRCYYLGEAINNAMEEIRNENEVQSENLE